MTGQRHYSKIPLPQGDYILKIDYVGQLNKEISNLKKFYDNNDCEIKLEIKNLSKNNRKIGHTFKLTIPYDKLKDGIAYVSKN